MFSLLLLAPPRHPPHPIQAIPCTHLPCPPQKQQGLPPIAPLRMEAAIASPAAGKACRRVGCWGLERDTIWGFLEPAGGCATVVGMHP